MICSSCRRSLVTRIQNLQYSSNNVLTNNVSSRIAIRTVATVPGTSNAAPSSPPPSTTSSTSTTPDAMSASTNGTSQPFSEPFFPSTTEAKTAPQAPGSPQPNAAAPIKLTSSVSGGTPLSALSYTKQTAKPLVALEDHEYPKWLWTLVADPNAPSAAVMDGGIDLSTLSKKTRARHERKQAKMMAGLEKPIPLHEQSKDLTTYGEDAVVSTQRRKELTHSMRNARRKGIREANFLRSM